MSKVEIINGVKYINGYLCNDAGQPITMLNGYSSQDEAEAASHYMRAKYYSRPRFEKKPARKKPAKRRKNVYIAPPEDELWK